MGCAQSKTTTQGAFAEQGGKPQVGVQSPVVEQGVKSVVAVTRKASTPKEEVVTHTVKVTIVSARGLRNSDVLEKQQPYCVVEVLGKSESRQKSPIGSHPTSPQWDHSSEVCNYCAGDSLVFTVKDKDFLADDKLGVATLDAEKVRAGFLGELKLTDAGRGVEAYLEVDVEGVDPSPTELAALTAARAAKCVRTSWEGKKKPASPDVKVDDPFIEDDDVCIFC